jgi:acyl-CoA synthetase (AMP-forming)/AMP-acid ligase II/acyl carrier protein
MMRSKSNGTSFLPSAADSLVEVLRRRASEMGHKEAFCYLAGDGGDEVAMTYRGLDERAMAIGAELQSMAAPGDRAILLFPPGLDFVAAFFGCMYAGIAAVPIAPPGRNSFAWSGEAILEASKPSLVLSTARHCQKAAQTYATPRLLQQPWVAVDTIPGDRAGEWRDPGIDGRRPAFLQYTSGSTSAPKGVTLSHRNLLNNAAIIQHAFGNTSDSRAVFWLPLYHDMGLIGGVIQPVYCGGGCTLMAPAAFLQRPAFWLETISRKRATVAGGPDFAFDACARKVRDEDRQGLDLSSWEVAFVGAEPIRAQTLDRFSRAFAPCGFRREAFFPCYGLAEATLMVSGGPRSAGPTTIQVRADALAGHRVRLTSHDGPAARRLVGCGESLPDHRIVIVDPETRLPCSDEQVGEVWVRGPSVACGYYEQPAATAAAFDGRLAHTGEGPFLRTGDLGFLRDNQLFVTGRLKDLIIIRGRNLYPEDIEQSVERAFDGLRVGYGAAFAVDGEDREGLVVVQEVEPRRRDLDLHRALQAIRHAIGARHDVEVRSICLVKAGTLLKTSSGKTRRSACREQYLSGRMEILADWQSHGEDAEEEESLEPSAASPRAVTAGEVEAWLSQRIASRLRLPRSQVLASTPFMEFGMSSLDAVEIAADLQRWLGRSLSPTAIYNYPSISALARWLAGPAADGRPMAAAQPAPLPQDQETDQFARQLGQLTGEEMDKFMLIVEELTQQEGP